MSCSTPKKWFAPDINDYFLLALIPEERPTWRVVAAIHYVPSSDPQTPSTWRVEASREKLYDAHDVISRGCTFGQAQELAQDLANSVLRRHGYQSLEA